ncbi:oxidoreductase family, NAD-binding Rossmann fold domain protein [Streptomyces himastatinicus ATCC 53653]|uniref:Oxidoreductase family, NAD-binding Rossmann fold domain protein n=1 Tax=Streptomyces himastatinicus ATCC 53653 TaxID=457427 RepID=D9WMM4_9ACTN|nr:Gfo/Idh/MocA family oxidoreductase [Streptomyces himastatinicus]EFL27890.1 oxidoreductase family, NAD-binding Rossmann fold domain protein [Streptomyces himastatinicus ATCC 53653]
MSQDIGVAVIGAGMAGRAHAHGYRSAGTVFSAGLPPVRLVSIADLNGDLARDTAARYGFERADTSWEAVVKADDIDVVSVVVANDLHREIVRELAAAGKHVLCEKPLAPSPEDARAMITDTEKAGIVARVGFTFRRAPGIGAVREQLRSGRLGRPLHVSAQYWTDYGSDPQAPMSWRYRGGPGSGALADLGSHLTDVAEFLLGPVETVHGAALSTTITERPLPLGHVVGHAHVEVSDEREPVGNDDWASYCARFASGATGDLSVSRIAFGHPNTLKFEVFCENGALSYDQSRPGEFAIATGDLPGGVNGFRRVIVGVEHPYIAGGMAMDANGIGVGHNDSFVYQARAFLDEVAGLEEIPRCAAFAEGLHNLDVLEAVTRSATRNTTSAVAA